MTVILFLVGFIALVAGLVILAGYVERCKGCGKMFSEVLISAECTKTEPTTKTIERKIRNAKGDVVGTIEDSVPATLYHYVDTFKCSNCGKIRYAYRDEVK